MHRRRNQEVKDAFLLRQAGPLGCDAAGPRGKLRSDGGKSAKAGGGTVFRTPTWTVRTSWGRASGKTIRAKPSAGVFATSTQ